MMTGIVRKIDELGRIVIPKEIRKFLNIKSGDDFEIKIDSNKIILEKYSKLETHDESINKIISCFLSDKINILYCSNNVKMKDNSILSKEVQNIIEERKIYVKNNEQIRISNTIYSNGNLVINPIVVDSDLLGSIIVYGHDNIEYMINISKIISKLIKKIILFA